MEMNRELHVLAALPWIPTGAWVGNKVGIDIVETEISLVPAKNRTLDPYSSTE
jgi:hypothetical protein